MSPSFSALFTPSLLPSSEREHLSGFSSLRKDTISKVVAVAALLALVYIAHTIFRSRQVERSSRLPSPGSSAIPLPPSTRQNDQDPILERTTVQESEIEAFRKYQSIGGSNIRREASAQNIRFFYANCDQDLREGRTDVGWGCAWRSIQTCLGSFSIYEPFQELYRKYRQNQRDESEWAEPEYAKRIFDARGFPSKLYLYRRDAGTDKTPTELCEKIPSFPQLVEILFTHFTTHQTPIMIDDVTYAWSILGIKQTKQGQVILWIADPHKTSRKEGLYYLVLDGQTGEKVDCTGIDKAGGICSAKRIDPKTGWILFLPQKKAIANIGTTLFNSVVSFFSYGMKV